MQGLCKLVLLGYWILKFVPTTGLWGTSDIEIIICILYINIHFILALHCFNGCSWEELKQCPKQRPLWGCATLEVVFHVAMKHHPPQPRFNLNLSELSVTACPACEIGVCTRHNATPHYNNPAWLRCTEKMWKRKKTPKPNPFYSIYMALKEIYFAFSSQAI